MGCPIHRAIAMGGSAKSFLAKSSSLSFFCLSSRSEAQGSAVILAVVLVFAFAVALAVVAVVFVLAVILNEVKDPESVSGPSPSNPFYPESSSTSTHPATAQTKPPCPLLLKRRLLTSSLPSLQTYVPIQSNSPCQALKLQNPLQAPTIAWRRSLLEPVKIERD
jgi:hypothetical protein